MPVLDAKHDHRKVGRPAGTKYATARGLVWSKAIDNALKAFTKEYGKFDQAQAVIEVVGDSFGWTATVMAVPDEERTA